MPSKRGKQSPAGSEWDGAVPLRRSAARLPGRRADNLPNDPRIHEDKGSKQYLLEAIFADARVGHIILAAGAPAGCSPDQASMGSGEGYLTGHRRCIEISHGALGPALCAHGRRETDIREAIGPQYSALEEAKADVVGEVGVKWLVDHGAFPTARQDAVYASYVAGIFRTVRFGIAEAHGAAEMMEFSYLVEQGAIHRNPTTKLYIIDFAQTLRRDGFSLAKRIARTGSDRRPRARRNRVQASTPRCRRS